MEHPKVFISHASEDKERFVIDFATKLRENGIDAWVDQWEIHIGDSLIDKIFEQGIKDADTFIIVLSKFSIKKAWVREELNAASLKRIEQNTKVLPIIIDEGIEIPEVLKTTVWEIIKDVNNYEESLKKVLASIYGIYNKPIIGTKPKFAVKNVEIQGLSHIDSMVFKAIYDEVFRTDNTILNNSSLEKIINSFNITSEEITDILDILENESLIKQTKFLGNQLPMVQVTYSGTLRYAENFIRDFPTIYRNLIALIINNYFSCAEVYASKLNHNKVLIEALLEFFNIRGFVRTYNTLSHGITVSDITAIGRRYFSEQLAKG